MEAIIGAIAGSICYRLRGGGADFLFSKPINNQILRSIWALFVTLSLPLGWQSIYIFAFAFLGALFGYFGGQFNLAEKGNRTWQNYSLLSARGCFVLLPLALTYGLLYSQLWYGVAFGALMPLCYLADNYLKKYVNWNFGELLLGAILGAILYGYN